MAVSIGAKVEAARKAQNKTRLAVALEAGVSQGMIWRIERDNEFPRADRLAAVAHVLGLSLDDLLADTNGHARAVGQ